MDSNDDIANESPAERALRQRVIERTLALADSEARLRSLIDSIGEAVIITGLDGRITDFNPAAERIYGWQAEEVMGQRAVEVLSTRFDDPFESAERSRAIAMREGAWRGMVAQQRKDGSPINIASTVALLRDANGQPVGLVGINRDITESKRTGAKLSRLERMNRAISRGLTVDDILATLMAEVRGLIPFDNVDLALITPDGGAYTTRDVFSQKPPPADGRRTPLAGSLLSIMRVTREPMIIPDIRERNFPARRLLEAEGVRSMMMLPLIIGGDLIGSINFNCSQLNAYTRRDADLLSTTAEQIAIAFNTARLLEDTRRKIQQLTALYEGGLAVSRLLDPESLAHEAIRVLEELVAFDYLAILLVDETTGLLQPFALSRPGKDETLRTADKERLRAFGIRVGQGIAGWVAETGQPARVGDVSADPRYIAVRGGIRSELCAPLKIGERVIGVINTETAAPDAYTEDDTRLLMAIAGPLAVAIENARLYGEAQHTEAQMRDLSTRLIRAQEDERARLAHELHDEVGQTLTILKLNLQSMQTLPEEERLPESFSEALNLVASLLDQIRALSLNLRPSLLDDLGLAPALRWYLDRAAQHSGLAVRFDAPDELRRFSTEVETALFRIAQESITNVLRHAQAKTLWVRLTYRNDAVELHIADDGIGFELPSNGAASLSGKSLGLSGIARRAALINAELGIDAAPGRGTQITVRVRAGDPP